LSRLPSFHTPTEAVVVWLTGDCGIANASNILEWMDASFLDPVRSTHAQHQRSFFFAE
jgi:hypothetical protein